jgi:hypothetical protein
VNQLSEQKLVWLLKMAFGAATLYGLFQDGRQRGWL